MIEMKDIMPEDNHFSKFLFCSIYLIVKAIINTVTEVRYSFPFYFFIGLTWQCLGITASGPQKPTTDSDSIQVDKGKCPFSGQCEIFIHTK